MINYDEIGYAEVYVEAVKELKHKYNLPTVALAYPLEGIAEFVFIEEEGCDIETLTLVDGELLDKVLSLAGELNLSSEVCFETAMCKLSELPEDIKGLLLL